MIGMGLRLTVTQTITRKALRVATIDDEHIYLPIRPRCVTKARKLAKKYGTEVQELGLSTLDASAMMFRACGGEGGWCPR